MPLIFLKTEVGVQRGLLVLAVFYFLLLGYVVQMTVPAYSHVCTYRDGLGITAILLLIISFIPSARSLIKSTFYLYMALSLFWVLHVLSESSLAPENGLILLAFFMIVSLGIQDIKFYRWIIVIFSLSLFATIASVEDPQTPPWLFAGLYTITAFITYLLLTNYKNIQLAHRKSTNNMSLLLDHIDECFILLDTELRIQKYNRKAKETILTFEEKSVKEGSKLSEYYQIENDSKFSQALEDSLKGSGTKYDHKSVDLIGGIPVERWYLLKFIPVFDGENSVNSIVFTALDITDHYHSSEKLLRSEKMFKNLFRKAPIGMALASDKGVVTEANDAYCQTVGYPPEEILDRTFAEYTHPDDIDYNYDLLRKLLNREINEYQLEKRYVQKNGKLIYVIVRVIVLKGLDGRDQLLAQVIDITRLKKVEDILKTKNRELQNGNKDLARLNVELEQTNMELDRFIYSASHDLRAPLTSLQGLINITRMEKGTGQNHYLDLMEKSVNRLDYFISEVIQFSENARTDLSLELVTDLPKVIEDRYQGLSFINVGGSIDFVVSGDHMCGFKVDKRRLEILINNLLSNSIKYHDPGKVDRFIKVRYEIENTNLLLEVEDNGIGIPIARQSKIFDFFYKAHEHSTGSGLGLYIVKQTIEKLNGKLGFISIEGKGTTFKLEIPVQNDIKSGMVA